MWFLTTCEILKYLVCHSKVINNRIKNETRATSKEKKQQLRKLSYIKARILHRERHLGSTMMQVMQGADRGQTSPQKVAIHCNRRTIIFQFSKNHLFKISIAPEIDNGQIWNIFRDKLLAYFFINIIIC
jgi:hypothetical protein